MIASKTRAACADCFAAACAFLVLRSRLFWALTTLTSESETTTMHSNPIRFRVIIVLLASKVFISIVGDGDVRYFRVEYRAIVRGKILTPTGMSVIFHCFVGARMSLAFNP